MSAFTEGISPQLQEKIKAATTKYGLAGGTVLVAHCDMPHSRISQLLLEGCASLLPGLGAMGRYITDAARMLEPLLDGLGKHLYEPPIYNKAWRYNRRYQRLAPTTWHYRTRKWTPERGYHWVYPERRRRYED